MESKKKFILALSILAFLIFSYIMFLSFEKSNKTEQLENLISISVKKMDREAIISVRETLIEVIIENSGSYEILIRNISSNFMIKNFSCNSRIILPKEKTLCSIILTPEPSLAFYIQVDYEYSKFGEKSSNSVIKWVINKLFLKPYEVKQIYIEHSEQLEKEFFYSFDVNGNKFYIGYECLNMKGRKKERVANLKFELSQLPDKAEILGAGIYLYVSKLSAPMDINLYYIYNEQDPLVEFKSGILLGSQKISNSGLHMFDVAEILREKKRLQDGTFQILPKDIDCNIKENYVEFSFEDKEGSFLEVIYINP